MSSYEVDIFNNNNHNTSSLVNCILVIVVTVNILENHFTSLVRNVIWERLVVSPFHFLLEKSRKLKFQRNGQVNSTFR